MALRVTRAEGLATVQDLGRFGYQRFGVSPSGAMDWYALCAANLLAGNARGAAALEAGLAGLTLTATGASLIALAGAGFELKLQGRPRPFWMALFVQAGWTIEITRTSDGGWAYLAAAGGIETPPLLRSRATYLRGQMGGHVGRKLQPGDVLPTGPTQRHLQALAGRRIPQGRRLAYTGTPTVEVILGPQAEAFTEEGLNTFLASEYAVSLTSDRMGYRLEGPPVAHRAGADIVSDGLATGAVQVPADGQPLVMMSDRPTTGGYAKIATVVTADLPRLAQAAPGSGRVRFQPTTVEAAQARYRQMMNSLLSSVEVPDEWEM